MNKDSMLIRGAFPDSAQIMDVVFANGRVRAVRRKGKSTPDVGDDDALLAPPLFDIQINGAGGIDLQRADLTVAHVAALNAWLVSRGVLRWIPTLVTDAPDALEHRCRILAAAMAAPALARHIPGIHLEGPHIAEADGPRGAHPRAHVLPPDLRLFNRLYKAAEGNIAYVTLAPETRGALKFMRALRGRGVMVALGHHAASEKQIAAAIAAGARLSTHLGNGMAPMVHRHHNALWPQLADDRLYASLIADLEHVPPAMLRVVARAKGVERLVLVSDSVFLAGMKPGRYEMFGAAVEMKRSGRVCLAGTELLAGSSLTLLNGVWNLHRNTDVSLAEAFNAASSNPARLLNMALPPWPPKPGQSAELLVCRQTGGQSRTSRLAVEAVLY